MPTINPAVNIAVPVRENFMVGGLDAICPMAWVSQDEVFTLPQMN
ncbi:MAG: hypothetical protein OXE92_02180 [Bacteroidetes bacterium]|nr:hypothetical protein [Bacteroidota bacterium]